MSGSSRRAVLLGLILVLLLLPPCRAEEGAAQRFLEGTHVFRRILLDMKLQPLTRVAELRQDPERTLLIIHGDPREALHSRRPQRLQRFLDAGGAVMLASDQPISSDSLRSELTHLLGYTIADAIFVLRNIEDATSWHRSDQCPILVPVKDAQPNLFRDPLNQPLVVAANRPSRLVMVSVNPLLRVTQLAELPDGTFAEGAVPAPGAPGLRPGPKEQQRLFAVSATSATGRGKLLLLADHSIFINGMMMPSDNQNVEFTVNCLEFLRGSERRDRVLFLEEGQVDSNFNIPLKDVPPALAEKGLRAVVGALDNHLAHLEDRNVFNQAIADWLDRHNITPTRLWQTGIAASTLLLLCWGCLRLFRTRGQRSDPALPLAAAVSDPTQSGTLAQRQREMEQTGNLWELARPLAREVFRAAGLVPTGTASPVLSRIVARGSWWQRWQRRHRTRTVWRLAFGTRLSRIAPVHWPRLAADLEQLQADLADGAVQVRLAE